MIEIPRAVFKNDSVYGKIYEILKRNHVVAKHTRDVLYKNRHIKDFCEEATHFAEIPTEPTLYVHYDVASGWQEPMGVKVVIDRIVIYDNFLEYETARMKGLHSGKASDIPNIN
jgi:hypothetical protein